MADVAAAYGASASPTQAELDAAAAGLSYFSFVSPDTMQGPDYLGGGIAAALKATAQFHLETNTVAAVAPSGTLDEDAFYAATTSAQSLADGLASIPASVLDTAGTGVTSIPESADSTCSGTVDLTATTGALTDGATTSYSNNLACEWRIASGGVVELTFTVFRVWTGDVVEVFDGSALVAKLHGFDRAWPPLRTTGDMTVKFTTDGVRSAPSTTGGRTAGALLDADFGVCRRPLDLRQWKVWRRLATCTSTRARRRRLLARDLPRHDDADEPDGQFARRRRRPPHEPYLTRPSATSSRTSGRVSGTCPSPSHTMLSRPLTSSR